MIKEYKSFLNGLLKDITFYVFKLVNNGIPFILRFL